jgi:8-hydroxy-5-deazaflavin:NADPH oxidoreductase
MPEKQKMASRYTFYTLYPKLYVIGFLKKCCKLDFSRANPLEDKMKIAIIGAGNVGQALAEAWSKKGHSLLIGARNESDEASKKFAQSVGATLTSPNKAVEGAEVVLLSVPWPAVSSLGKELPLQNKIVIDCVNPLKPDFSGLALGTTTSGAEFLQDLAPKAKVVKAFNTVGFNIMKNPTLEGRKVAMAFCGNDKESNLVVKKLIEDVGFEPMESGPLSTARLLEPVALFWILSALKFGTGRGFGFSIVRG